MCAKPHSEKESNTNRFMCHDENQSKDENFRSFYILTVAWLSWWNYFLYPPPLQGLNSLQWNLIEANKKGCQIENHGWIWVWDPLQYILKRSNESFVVLAHEQASSDRRQKSDFLGLIFQVCNRRLGFSPPLSAAKCQTKWKPPTLRTLATKWLHKLLLIFLKCFDKKPWHNHKNNILECTHT